MVDLFRTTGQFDLAFRICEEGLKKNPEGIISHILQLQKTLIGRQDVACHNVQEAIPTVDQN